MVPSTTGLTGGQYVQPMDGEGQGEGEAYGDGKGEDEGEGGSSLGEFTSLLPPPYSHPPTHSMPIPCTVVETLPNARLGKIKK